MSSPQQTVASPSAEAIKLGLDLQVIEDVRGGIRAMRARADRYLKRYEAETLEEWRRRVDSAPWRDEFNDALGYLSSRPFAKPVGFGPDAPAPVVAFGDDVDAQGSNITTFAKNFFTDALADGMCVLLVDTPRADGARTVADQKALGIRPYWVRYCAASVLALKTQMIRGRREIVNMRLRETTLEPDGLWGEREVTQIRVLTPGAWETWRKNDRDEWTIFESGEMFTTPSGAGVPAIAFFTGERLGDLLVKPPLIEAAWMAVELWRALSRLDETMVYSASPLLCAVGSAAPLDGGSVAIGPKRALFAPEGGDWKFIMPDAQVIEQIRQHVIRVQEDFSRLSLRPMIERASLTATAAVLSNSRSASQLEAWTLQLRDCLQTALGITLDLFYPDEKKAVGNWQRTVDIHADFSSELSRLEESAIVISAAKSGLISPRVAAHELTRRGVIGPGNDVAGSDQEVEAS